MASLIVMYKTPTDVAAFDQYYYEKHIPRAKRIPGLQKYTVSNGLVMTPAGPSPFHLIATLSFDSLAEIQAAFASPEGQAAAGDLQNFASGGADFIMSDTKDV